MKTASQVTFHLVREGTDTTVTPLNYWRMGHAFPSFLRQGSFIFQTTANT
jgi:hypothetical protein